jgi:hypothetical protein
MKVALNALEVCLNFSLVFEYGMFFYYYYYYYY